MGYSTNNPLSRTAKICMSLGLAGLVGVAVLVGKSNERLRTQENQRASEAFATLDKTRQFLSGTNDYIPIEVGQDFLKNVGIDYQLAPGETLTFSPSMADNWQGVYVNTKQLNSGQREPEYTRGFTTISNLQKYISSHQ
jgi:hypothetical protein